MAAPKENKNAEKWSEKEAETLFSDALKLSVQNDFDFIGEVARELGTYRDIFTYLSDKFPSLKSEYNKVLSNLEANCFSHSKSGMIKEATAIVNLKSNYKWTDRIQNDNVNKNLDLSNLTDEEFEEQLRQANRVLNG
ncbi:hypothetical protein OAD31_04755 [Planktomarina temperata]|jgi:hypothetical protein|nr:hypothetical protein [Planktomarina temperata]